jgi:hypothetical protein
MEGAASSHSMLTLSEAITNRRVQDLSTNPLTYDHDDDANHTNAAKRLSSTRIMRRFDRYQPWR